MPLKKQNYTDEGIPIFDEAFIYKRGAYWHFRMWLNNERKYARKSLRTRSKTTAIEKGKEAYLEIFANRIMCNRKTRRLLNGNKRSIATL